MKALELLSFFNSRARQLRPYRLGVVDSKMAPGQPTNVYPIMRVEIEAEGKEILLVIRFPDEPDNGDVLSTVGEVLDLFLPAASDHPDFAVEASVPVRVMNFSRADMPIVGVAGSDEQQVVMLLANGVDYLEKLAGI